MSALIINYAELAHTENHARSLVDKMDTYITGLNKTGTQCGAVTGGSSSALSSAQYYIDAKVTALKKKKERYNNYANKLHAFSENAKRIDKEVKTAIVNEQKRFLSIHDNLKINAVKAAFINFLTGMKNFCPVFDFIGTMFQKVFDKIKSIQDAIQDWYYLQGGREKLQFWGAIAGAVALILLAVAAWPAELGIIAIAGFIGACIAAINGIVNIVTSYKAWKAAESGDPTWAKRYSKQDKLSDVLRETNYGNAEQNAKSMIWANGLDKAELICDCIDIVGTVKKFNYKSKFEFLNRTFDQKNGLGKYITTERYKWVFSKSDDGLKIVKQLDKDAFTGKAVREVTLKSAYNGFKEWAKDGKIAKQGQDHGRAYWNFVKGTASDYVGAKNKVNGFMKYHSAGTLFDTAKYTLKNNSFVGMFDRGMEFAKRKEYIKTSGKTIKKFVNIGKVSSEIMVGNHSYSADVLKQIGKSFGVDNIWTKGKNTIECGKTVFSH